MLRLAFFLSGLAAVIYQLIWQRVLLGIYGANIESVTVVVTAFMLGLGAGSLAGGRLADRLGVYAPRAFAAIELAIGLFGLVSSPLFHWAGRLTSAAGPGALWPVVFLLLLVPTALMGATLPVLTAYATRRLQNVGAAVAGLYAVNTLGSAGGAILAVLVIAGQLGQQGSVVLAAGLNLLAAGIVILRLGARGARREEGHSSSSGSISTQDSSRASSLEPQAVPSLEPRAPSRHASALLLIALASGFIALSFEIVWYRAYSIALMARPQAFGVLLGGYLAGIAFGAWVGGRICRRARDGQALARALGWSLVAAGVIAFLLLPAFAFFVTVSRNWAVALALVAAGAAALGVVFPLAVHASAPAADGVGRRTSYVYGADIIGFALGSLITGFWLMDHAGIATITTGLGMVTVALGAVCHRLSDNDYRLSTVGDRSSGRPRLALAIVACVLSIAVILAGRTVLFGRVYERLMFRVGYGPATRFVEVVENRSGVIGVMADGAVYGSGVYDGHYSTDLRHARINLIHRAYALGLFHPAPRRVLMIGLSSGSWAGVVANHPGVEQVTVVEINPGYVGLLSQHPVVFNLATDRRVSIVIDDGRRWLAQHGDERFDVIVANTTYHWRANATSLLSTEFLDLVKRHLNPGGVYYFNTTSEPRVQKTAAAAFASAWRVYGMMAVGDAPIVPNFDRFRDQLGAYRLYGEPSLDLASADDRALRDLIVGDMAGDLEPRDRILARTKDLALVTDDNMGTEWTRR